jgi:hypothetical protein
VLVLMSTIRFTGPGGRSPTAMLGEDGRIGSRVRGSKTSVPGLKYWLHQPGSPCQNSAAPGVRLAIGATPFDPTAARSRAYLMISSADTSSEAGTVRPSVLAVLRLITSSSFSGVKTGISAGLAPLRILPA